MNVTLNCKKADGKKGLEIVTVSKELAEAVFNAFVGKEVTTDDGKAKIRPLKEERIADSASLASIWDKVTAKYPTLDTISIDGYQTARSVSKTLSNGEKVSSLQAFDAKMLVKNMNLVSILTGIASDLEAEGKMSKGTKTLYHASVQEEAIGYNKGKRGRTKKIINKEARTSALLASL